MATTCLLENKGCDSVKFTILGMGNTGHTAACYLLSQGYEVTIWDRNSSKLTKLQDRGIAITGQLEGNFCLKTEKDLAIGIADADYILIFTIASAHKKIAELLKDKLRKNQKIIIFNGVWGAVELHEVLKEEQLEKNIIIAETGAQIFAASLIGTCNCHLKSIKKGVDIASVPIFGADIIIKELKTVFPQFIKAGNVIETSMNASNPIAHCPINLFNLARIDSGEELLMFKSDYTSRLAVKYVQKVDEERIKVMEKIGIKAKSLLSIFNTSWSSSYKDLYDAFKGIKSYQSAKSPSNFEFRHFTEDIPFGIMPIQSLARIYGISTPYLDTMINMYELILDNKYKSITPDFNAIDLKEYLNGENNYE